MAIIFFIIKFLSDMTSCSVCVWGGGGGGARAFDLLIVSLYCTCDELKRIVGTLIV